MPIITLEVMSETSQKPLPDMPRMTLKPKQADDPRDIQLNLSENSNEILVPASKDDKEEPKEVTKARSDLLEYVIRTDGSVICKLCGEILQSRTHWYRHKYKLHVMPPLNPAPLFQCEQCMVYFKSRKGYIGHLASRHTEGLSDSNSVLNQTQTEPSNTEKVIVQTLPEIKNEPEAELAITTVTRLEEVQQSYQATVVRQPITRDPEVKRRSRTSSSKDDKEWEEKRLREEKLVADIINRVRRECEAQGSGGPARRGYSRRTTVMHT